MAEGERLKMRVSLPGILLRAANRCERSRDDKHLGYPLRELLEHLRQLREDPSLHDEFFALYVDDRKDV